MRRAFWLKCVFCIWGSHLHLDLDFGCNVHILEEMCIWENTFTFVFWLQCTHFRGCAFEDHICICIVVVVHTYFGGNAHLKYNCIHMFMEKMTLIKHYCYLYHISLRIEENKTNFASWMHEPHSNPNPNPIISHFRWHAINQT